MGTQLPSPKRGQTPSFHTIGEVARANLSFICCVVMIPEQNGLLLYVCVHPRYIVFNKVWCDVPVNRVLHLNGHLSSGYAQRPPFCLRQPYGIGQAIYIFSSCRLLILFFPRLHCNLSRHRLDVCHTSTHGVWIYDAGLKRAARSSLKIQDAKKVTKNCHLGTIAQLCRTISSQLRHVSTIGKNFLSSNMASTCPHNMVNFGSPAAEIGLPVWGTPANFNRFCVLAALLQGVN